MRQCDVALSDYTGAPTDPAAASVLLSGRRDPFVHAYRPSEQPLSTYAHSRALEQQLSAEPTATAAQLLLSHLDRAQLISAAALELLRLVAAVSGSARPWDAVVYGLALRHESDWPELRLSSVPSSTRDGLTTLPMLVPSVTQLFDYRCHAPGGTLGTAYSRPLATCLAALAGATASFKEDRAVASTLGVASAAQWAAVSSHARLMLDAGMEAAVLALAVQRRRGHLAAQPPCCSVASCSPPPPAPPPPPPWALSSFQPLDQSSPSPAQRLLLRFADLVHWTRPHHPRALGLLLPPPARRPAASSTELSARSHAPLSAGESSVAASSTVEAAPPHGRRHDAPSNGARWHTRGEGVTEGAAATATRDAAAFYARAAAARLADAGALLPAAFDAHYRNPCWPCANGSALMSSLDGGSDGGGSGGDGGGSGGRLCCLPYASARLIEVSTAGGPLPTAESARRTGRCLHAGTPTSLAFPSVVRPTCTRALPSTRASCQAPTRGPTFGMTAPTPSSGAPPASLLSAPPCFPLRVPSIANGLCTLVTSSAPPLLARTPCLIHTSRWPRSHLASFTHNHARAGTCVSLRTARRGCAAATRRRPPSLWTRARTR